MNNNKREEHLFRDRYMRRRLLVTLAAAVLLGVLYSLIFRFSAQDSGESGSLSRTISEKCAGFINWLSGSCWNKAREAEVAEWLEYPLRKMAHFSEYASMGVLVYTLWSQWIARGKRLYFLTVMWVFLSAAGDEFHQYFVPGRCASIADVMLDTGGGVFGMLFCVAVDRLYRHCKVKKKAAGILKT